MRLFLGITLSADATRGLESVCLRYRSSNDGLRWSTPESWHITLQFLGNSSLEQYECVVAALRPLRIAPIRVDFEELGFFERAGIFHAGVRPTPPLVSFVEQINSVTAPCGFPAEARPYRPHITLARAKGRRTSEGLRRLKTMIRQPALSGFTAHEFLLYESHIHATGSRYEVRERFALETQ